MKKFELFCIQFALYVYVTYIKEDWDIYNKFGKIYYFFPWFIRSCLIWAICPIFIPEYFFKQTSLYKYIQKMKNSPEYQAQLYKSMKNLHI